METLKDNAAAERTMSDELPVVPPPASVTVEERQPQPVLYDARGNALTRDRSIGFVSVISREKQK